MLQKKGKNKYRNSRALYLSCDQAIYHKKFICFRKSCSNKTPNFKDKSSLLRHLRKKHRWTKTVYGFCTKHKENEK